MSTAHMLVQLRLDGDGEPYFRVVTLPFYLQGEGASMTPQEARAYARALMRAADECDAWPSEVSMRPDVLRIFNVIPEGEA